MTTLSSPGINTAEAEVDERTPLTSSTEHGNREASTLSVLRKVLPMAALVFATFTTTSSLWPGLTTAMQPVHGNNMNGWFQIIIIVCCDHVKQSDFGSCSLPFVLVI
jgi:hypothetical protein